MKYGIRIALLVVVASGYMNAQIHETVKNKHPFLYDPSDSHAYELYIDGFYGDGKNKQLEELPDKRKLSHGPDGNVKLLSSGPVLPQKLLSYGSDGALHVIVIDEEAQKRIAQATMAKVIRREADKKAESQKDQTIDVMKEYKRLSLERIARAKAALDREIERRNGAFTL